MTQPASATAGVPLPTQEGDDRPADIAVDDGLQGTIAVTTVTDATVATRRKAVADAVLAELDRRKQSPRASYRCQFHCGFGFREAAAIVPYLSDLGISHIYASPILRARPGSGHGYDVCDPQALDPELGGDEAFAELVANLKASGLGLILDIVPNHMSTHAANQWWSDVLENGQNSPYSKYFDIDWHPVKPELYGEVLLPILGDQYGTVLESGDLRVAYQDGAFMLRYGDHVLPIGPRTARDILSARLDELRAALAEFPEQLGEYESILTALDHLPPASETTRQAMIERQRDKEIIKRRLRDLTAASPAVEHFIAQNVVDINGVAGEPASFDRLDALLAAQSYRLCHWKAASDEVNYRRFFDINELAAVCMEDPEVFYRSHKLIMRLAAEGAVNGLRIDHIDGLYAPEQYLWRLQWAYLTELAHREFAAAAGSPAPTASDASSGSAGTSAAWIELMQQHDPAARDTAWAADAPSILLDLCRRLQLPCPGADDWIALLGAQPASLELAQTDLAAQGYTPEAHSVAGGELPLFVVVEKILGPHEPLPESWPVAGTTGYDFLQMCDGLFVADDGWRQLKRDYARITAQPEPFEAVVRDCKRLILRVAMGSELQMLAHRLNHISEQHRRSRDFTLNLLRLALREILVSFPIYRIYPGPAGVSDRDRRFVTQAVAMAKRRNPAVDAGAFDFVRDVLLLVHPDGLSAESIHEREVFAGRFQQVTSPVMAKGCEDTAFYVYGPLVSVNEVGNGPESPTTAPRAFHDWNQLRATTCPQAMLAASTHDTKRSEDVRARLHVLSEMPKQWRTEVQRWFRLNRRRRTNVDGAEAPSRSDEYLFYQCLLGIWPPLPPDSATQAEVTERMRAYMSKATHEAKQHTSWISPNEAYDRAIDTFVTASLRERRDNRFLAVFRAALPRIAHLGLLNSLAETTLRLLCPGFPDIYNGQELWSFRLVDPDNRVPVDYDERRRLLAEMQSSLNDSAAALPFARELACDLPNPRTKLYLTWRLLQLRQRLCNLFADGDYVPLTVTGARAEHVVAFARVPKDSASAGKAVVVIVPRLVARLIGDSDAESRLPLGPDVWQDTAVEIPPALGPAMVDELTGVQRSVQGAAPLAELFSDFPVVILAPQHAPK